MGGPPPVAPPPMATGVYPATGPVREREREVAYSPPPQRRRKRWPWLLLGALGLMGLILLLVTVLSPERVRVPNVVGSSISVATQRLQSEGFEVVPVRDNSDKPRNTVIGQDPGAGTTADEGSRVTITVSDGPSITDVPDVVGDGRVEARRKLTDAGFKVSEKRVQSDTVRPNRVVSQSPDGGSLAERGRVVTIELSSGPQRLPVPDVVGDTEDEARTALDAFRVVVQEREDDEADPGIVLAQRPAGGTLPRGATVTLTVAIEPREVTVPDIVGRSQNLATRLLSARGFEVSVEEEVVDAQGKDGIVQEQSPGGGDKAERGSTVTISVGRFEPAVGPGGGQPTTTTPATTTTTPAP